MRIWNCIIDMVYCIMFNISYFVYHILLLYKVVGILYNWYLLYLRFSKEFKSTKDSLFGDILSRYGDMSSCFFYFIPVLFLFWNICFIFIIFDKSWKNMFIFILNSFLYSSGIRPNCNPRCIINRYIVIMKQTIFYYLMLIFLLIDYDCFTTYCVISR